MINTNTYVESMTVQYEVHTKHISAEIVSDELPKDYIDLNRMLANAYIESKGLKLTIDEILLQHYPEVMI